MRKTDTGTETIIQIIRSMPEVVDSRLESRGAWEGEGIEWSHGSWTWARDGRGRWIQPRRAALMPRRVQIRTWHGRGAGGGDGSSHGGVGPPAGSNSRELVQAEEKRGKWEGGERRRGYCLILIIYIYIYLFTYTYVPYTQCSVQYPHHPFGMSR